MDGPCSNVKRQAISFSKLSLTDFKISISRSAREKQVRKAYEAAEVNQKWEQTAWARRISKKARRQQLTDFDRFKLRVLRQQVTIVWTIEVMRCHPCCVYSEILHCAKSSQPTKERSSQEIKTSISKFYGCFLSHYGYWPEGRDSLFCTYYTGYLNKLGVNVSMWPCCCCPKEVGV